MRTLVILAVMGVCSATYQAYNHNHGYNPHSAPVQPKWTGPVAATVPAGVGGKVTPVGDTPEVAAARNAFFQVYQNQLASLGGTPGYTRTAPAVTHAAPSVTHAASPHSYNTPVYTPTHSYGAHGHGVPAAHGVSGPVGDTPEVAAAKAQFFSTFKKQAAAAAAAPDDYVTYH